MLKTLNDKYSQTPVTGFIMQLPLKFQPAVNHTDHLLTAPKA